MLSGGSKNLLKMIATGLFKLGFSIEKARLKAFLFIAAAAGRGLKTSASSGRSDRTKTMRSVCFFPAQSAYLAAYHSSHLLGLYFSSTDNTAESRIQMIRDLCEY